MGVLFLVLKILLFLLLALLGLVILLLLLVLLVPLRYRIKGSYQSEPDGQAQVSWLLHALLAKAVYTEGRLSLNVCVFGFRVFRQTLWGGETESGENQAEAERGPGKDTKASPVRPQGNAEKPQNLQKPDALKGAGAQSKPTEKSDADAKSIAQDSGAKPAVSGAGAKSAASGSGAKSAASAGTGERTQSLMGRLARLSEKIRVTIAGICVKLKKAKEKKDRFLAFVEDGANQKTFRLLTRQVFRLLRHILPYRADGRVKFGFDDPYTTGQVLQYISPFYALYAKRVSVTPVFGEEVLEGELAVRGRIRMGTVLILGARILFDQNFRRLMKRWRSGNVRG